MEETDETVLQHSPLEEVRRLWRERLLRRLSWWVAAAGSVTLVAFAMTSFTGLTAWVFVPLVVVVVATLCLPALPYPLRSTVVVGSLFAACIFPMLTHGFLPNILSGLLVVCLLAALLLGRSGGIVAAAAGVVAIIGLGLLFVSPFSMLEPNWAQDFDPTFARNNMRIALMFLVVSAMAIVSVTSIIERAETLLVERSRALESLSVETRERESIQAELQRREQAYRKAEEVEILGRLASFAAHDFSNSLLLIQASADLAQQEAVTDPEVLFHLSGIQAGVEQATATVRQLRGFGGTDSPERVHLRLDDFMDRTTPMLRSILPPPIEIEIDAAPTLPIAADPGELLRIVTNLALNARDAMRDGGSLSIGWRTKNETEVLLTVADSGPGMEKEIRDRIFEPFFTTKGRSGTGLGLASVRESVTANGARIEVDSRPGAGTRFEILWPAAPRESAEVAPSPSRPAESLHPPEPSAAPFRALIVDDEAAIRRTLGRELRVLGYAFEEAATAGRALEIIESGTRFDLLVTDCSMPGPHVSEIVESFRKALPRARIVLSTGLAREEIEDVARRVDVFLAKPFSLEELRRALVGERPA